MEVDDDFGDIYADVPQPSSSSSSLPPPPQNTTTTAAPPFERPIDLNLSNHDDDDTTRFDSSALLPSDNRSLVISVHNSISTHNDVSRVLPSTDDANLIDKDLNFDIEEAAHTGTTVVEDDDDSGPMTMMMIPGLAFQPDDSKKKNGVADDDDDDDDWEEDSDSEDDLRIVLNDTNHGPMGMERGMMGDGEDDDEEDDEDPLVIVAGGDPGGGGTMEEPDWGVGGEDAAAAGGADGERKESGEAAGKGNNAVAVPKLGYSNHGYHHPFHSQYKVSVAVAVVAIH